MRFIKLFVFIAVFGIFLISCGGNRTESPEFSDSFSEVESSPGYSNSEESSSKTFDESTEPSGVFESDKYEESMDTVKTSSNNGFPVDSTGPTDRPEETIAQTPSVTSSPVRQPSRLDITKEGKYVSILYLTWFNDHVVTGEPIYDISKILRDDPENPQWGPPLAKHFWAEPALGYYRSDDVQVMKTHMRQLHDMGVDFIILDTTNNRQSWPPAYARLLAWDPIDLLLETMLEMRKNGEKTPYVSFWAGTWTDDVPDTAAVPRYIYNRYYKPGNYDELFVYYQGKPLINVTDDTPDEIYEYFTVRKKWGMRHDIPEGEWSGLEKYPQRPGEKDGVIEHLVVSAATQINHMNLTEAVGPYLPPLPRNGGRYYAKQWSRAFELEPKIVFITEWNSWSAIRFVEIIDGVEYTFFTDSYDIERSRCIEPMKYGYKDLYYRWTKEYIRAYKAGEQMPEGLHIEEQEHVMTWD